MINNFSIKVKGGESILITGASGIGKSTLLNLIFRMLDPIEGEIKVDG